MRKQLKNLWPLIIIYAALTLIAMESMSAEVQVNPAVVHAINNAAKLYKLNAQSMMQIAYVESSFKSNAVRHNKNYTMDYGLFQINSIHWHTTCTEFNVFSLEGNSMCAAKLIAMHKLNSATHDVNWLGRYHSKTQSKKLKYINKLKATPKFTMGR